MHFTIERIALLHLKFEKIHPINNGNGRTDRCYLT
ncbi:Fic family protein [Anaeromicropila herbilytica]